MFEYLEYDYMDFGIKFAVFLVLYLLFIVMAQIALAVTVNRDCKAKNNQKATMWTVLVFFFPFIAGIIYLCIRNDGKNLPPKRCLSCGEMVDIRYDFCPRCNSSAFDVQPPEYTNQYKKKAKTSLIFTIITYVIAIVMCVLMFVQIMGVGFDALKNDFDPYGSHFAYGDDNGKKCYFDKKGNLYTESEEVLYYDREDNVYRYEEDDNVFIDDNGEKYYTYFTYVDSDGYFVYDEDNKIFMTDDRADEGRAEYVDSEGNKYHYAPYVSWDSQGNLVDSAEGTPLN